MIRFPGVPLWGCNGAKRRSTVARFARLHGSGHGSPPTPSVLSGGPRGATPRISAPKVTLFGGSGDPPGPRKPPLQGPQNTPRKPPENPPKTPLFGGFLGGPREVPGGSFLGSGGSFLTVFGGPGGPPKNPRKMPKKWSLFGSGDASPGGGGGAPPTTLILLRNQCPRNRRTTPRVAAARSTNPASKGGGDRGTGVTGVPGGPDGLPGRCVRRAAQRRLCPLIAQ